MRIWVQKGEDKKEVEADVVLTKSKAKKSEGVVELLSIREMIARKFTAGKIQAVIGRSKGIPDEDDPKDPSLMQYWVTTSRKRTETEEEKMEASMRLKCTPTAAGLASLMTDADPQSSGGAQAMTPQAFQELHASLASAIS